MQGTMSSGIQQRRDTGFRRASDYTPVRKAEINNVQYPAQSPSLIIAIHDLSYYQGLLSNSENYSNETELEVIACSNGETSKRKLLGELECSEYVKVCLNIDMPCSVN